MNQHDHTNYNSIEYFATLGHKSGHFLCKEYSSLWNEDSTVSITEIWFDAITDITLVLPDMGEDLVDNTWEYVGDYIGGLPANCNIGDQSKPIVFLAIRRRKDCPTGDHITQVYSV